MPEPGIESEWPERRAEAITARLWTDTTFEFNYLPHFWTLSS
jgi:hypothetical protein